MSTHNMFLWRNEENYVSVNYHEISALSVSLVSCKFFGVRLYVCRSFRNYTI